MSDIKLFRVGEKQVAELEGHSASLEKHVQNLIEKHLTNLLGVRFLSSEYSTGKTHRGRIDTLGIDEDNCPVIIEYKCNLKENVINQGLFYLDWLMDHQAEFKLLVLDKLGKDVAETIEWGGTRLLCIASDFTKYDEHAVQQIDRNIELIRYRYFDKDIFLLELVNSNSTSSSYKVNNGGEKTAVGQSKTINDTLVVSNTSLQSRFEALKVFLLSLGDDVSVKVLKNYFAFKRMKNFACVELFPTSNKISVFLRINPEEVSLEDGFTKDVRNIGHHGTGDLQITITSDEDLEKAKELLIRGYERN